MDSTGIEALDEILGGGLPRPSGNLIAGPKRSAKSILIKELVTSMLQQGRAVSYYTIDDSADQARTDLATLGLDVDAYEKTQQLCFMDIFSRAVDNVADSWVNHKPGETVLMSGLHFTDLVEMGREFTMQNLKRHIPEVVVMESLTPFFLMNETREVFHYLQTLKYATRFAKAIGIAVHHTGLLDTAVENTLYSFSDVVLQMEQTRTTQHGSAESTSGTLSVVRTTAQTHRTGRFYYEVLNGRLLISTLFGIL